MQPKYLNEFVSSSLKFCKGDQQIVESRFKDCDK